MILILGGTSLAHRLALALGDQDVLVSLAGVTEDAPQRPYRQRRGGFGGAEGLAQFLKVTGATALIDATHPFAAQMSRNAVVAAAQAGTPLLRLCPAPWTAFPDGWISVASLKAAASSLPAGARVLLTVGRNSLGPFTGRRDCWFLSRGVAAAPEIIPRGTYLQARPPFTAASESELMQTHRITHLVAKNAGGVPMRTKLDAARDLGIPIIMVERPELPVVDTRDSIEEVLAWLRSKKALA